MLQFEESLEVNASHRTLGQRCRKIAAHVGLALLPSFLRDFWTQSGYEHVDQLNSHANSGNSRRETAFLDGMRGLAAVCVFLEHFLIPFWKNIFYSYGGAEGTALIQLPIIRLIYSGSPMVCIFFVISGIALSIKPVRLINDAEWLAFYNCSRSMIFRRGIRLFAPSVLVSLGFMAAAHFGLCDIQTTIEYNGPPEVEEEFWKHQPLAIPDLWKQLEEWLDFIITQVLIPKTWRGTTTGIDYGDLEHIQYGSQLWSIGVEYWASLIFAIVMIGTSQTRSGYKTAIFIGGTGFSLWVGRWDVALFLYGSLLAQLFPFKVAPESEKHTRFWREALLGVSLCVGLHFASYPELNGSHTPGFIWLSTAYNVPRFWQSIGAALVVGAIRGIQGLRKAFSCAFLQYLGRISFSLYLIHIPMLATLGWRLVPIMLEVTGQESVWSYGAGISVSLCILFPLMIWASDLLHRFVDEPCMSFAHYLEKKMQDPSA